MSKIFSLTFITVLFISFSAIAQIDKSKRPSPPAKVSETTKKGITISIDYSRPSIKGRKIGTDLAPFGKIWRTGANEATVFEVNKNVTIEGQTLPAGKYSLYSIPDEKEWVIIFNKSWNQWGTKYSEADDQLRIKVKPEQAEKFQEQLTFNISKAGEVSLEWGNTEVEFTVK